jgi:transcriptional antiterminator RfaH
VKTCHNLANQQAIRFGAPFALSLPERGHGGCTMEQAQTISKKWYVVVTKARSEEVARFHLTRKGIEAFYPKLFLPVSNKPGRHIVSLFPNYLFVRIDVATPEYSQVAWCRGVKRLVSFGGTPAVVEEHIIDFMRERADQDGLIMARPDVKIGDEVQITSGPFKGLVGIIQEPPNSKCRVKVLMGILSRNVQVEVPVASINMRWMASCAV